MHTSFMASPMTKTRVWSETVLGVVRKKKAMVMWKSDRERMMVAAVMRAIFMRGFYDAGRGCDIVPIWGELREAIDGWVNFLRFKLEYEALCGHGTF